MQRLKICMYVLCYYYHLWKIYLFYSILFSVSFFCFKHLSIDTGNEMWTCSTWSARKRGGPTLNTRAAVDNWSTFPNKVLYRVPAKFSKKKKKTNKGNCLNKQLTSPGTEHVEDASTEGRGERGEEKMETSLLSEVWGSRMLKPHCFSAPGLQPSFSNLTLTHIGSWGTNACRQFTPYCLEQLGEQSI